MTARECLAAVREAGADFQRAVSPFVDEFRCEDADGKRALVEDPIEMPGALERLVSAAVNALCREADIDAPEWVSRIGSSGPFFAFPAKSYALRLRLMLESRAPFRIRKVFAPENCLSRA